MSQLYPDKVVQVPQGVRVEVFAPPADEARRLVRTLGWLVAPADGTPRWFHRLFGFLCISPFTQFTFVSFELQAFLFNVFHTRLASRLGHLLLMPVVNFFVMVALAQLRLGPHPVAHGWAGPGVNGATLYALLLIGWYFAVARTERLFVWWALTIPLVLALALGADAYYCHTFAIGAARTWYAPTPLLCSPYLWMAVASHLIADSHVPEPLLPPRLSNPWRWISLREYLFGTPDAPHGVGKVLLRVVLSALELLAGAVNEWWAAPRLMPYNWLILMFRLGYKPALWSRLKSQAERALASGNPAVDFVGIGGGAYLRSDVHQHELEVIGG